MKHFTLLIVVAFARMLTAEPCDVMVVGGGPAGIAAAVNGIATAEFLTNVDDAKGAYTLKCHDRASGLTVV